MAIKLWEAPTANAFNTTLDGTIDDSTATITLTSTTNLVAPGILVIDRQTAAGSDTPALREYVSFTGISSSDVTGVVRGVANSTAQSHESNAVVESVVSVTNWNDLIDWLEAEHITATGQHDMTSPRITTAIVDSSDNELIKLVKTTDAINEFEITNAATNNNPTFKATGGDDNITLELASKGTGEVKISTGDLNLPSGANINEAGTNVERTISLPSASFTNATSGPPGTLVTVESSANKVDINVRDFDKTSEERVFTIFGMPNNWDGGTIKFKVFWTATTAGGGSAGETVVWGLKGVSLADDDAIDTAYGSEITVTDTVLALDDLHASPWSTVVTLSNTPSAGDLVQLKLSRKPGSDNLNGDARLIAVVLKYSIDKYADNSA